MPSPEWYAADEDDADRATPATGHRAADVSDPDARHPLEDTPTYLRRLSTELKEARDTIEAHALANGGCVPEPAYRDLGDHAMQLAIEVRELRAEVARLTPKPGCRVCGRPDCCAT